MTSLQTLGRQTLVYGLSGAAPQVVGLLILPVLARLLTTADYGVVELAVVTVGLAAIVADLGLTSASQRSFFDYTDGDVRARRTVLATTLVVVTTTSVTLAVAGVAFRTPISRALFGTPHRTAIVGWMAATLLATQVAGFAREVLRLNFWAGSYLVSSVLAAVLGGIVSVVGVAAFDWGPQAVLAGGVLGAVASAAYGLARARGRYTGQFSPVELRRMVGYGVPLIPTALSLWAMTFVDRLLVQHYGSLGQVGEYAMANRLASVPLLGVTAFGIAFSPFALDLRTRDPDGERQVRARALTALVASLAVIGAAFSIFAREVLAVLAPRFDAAADTVGLLCLGVLFYGISSVVMLEISIARRTRIFAAYSVAGGALNVGLNLALIPPLGIAGAGLATAAAFSLLAAGYWWHAQAIAPTPYQTALVVELVAAATAAGAVGLLPLGPLYLLAKVAALSALAGLLVLHGLLRPRVVRSILDALRPSLPGRIEGNVPE